jgi:3-deoxy-manno-octulosonate cytidylyltransferase (CMP-KDO synthetase)
LADQVLAVIPARYASTRFPGKALALLAGKPMIVHVLERVRLCGLVSRVLVATDDARIFDVVNEAGGEAVMTRSIHSSGTERLGEVAHTEIAPFYVNVQGDEPLIEPAAVDAAVEALLDDTAARSSVSTLAVPLHDFADIQDPNIVKVVTDFDGHALYFSRSPIPHTRTPAEAMGPVPTHYKHLGVYVYRREVLLAFPGLRPGRLERLEKLEQLRLLEHGYRIRVVVTSHDAVSVDVPADLARVEALLKSKT